MDEPTDYRRLPAAREESPIRDLDESVATRIDSMSNDEFEAFGRALDLAAAEKVRRLTREPPPGHPLFRHRDQNGNVIDDYHACGCRPR